MIESLLQDLKYAARMLSKSPAYTLICLLTLGLGIGANTALFSVINGVLLKPLPYPRPSELMILAEKHKEFQSGSSISYPNFLDWQRSNSTFARMAAYRSDDFTITGSGEAELLHVGKVSAGFFEILGISPIRGRLFTAEDDRANGAPVVLITAGLWKRKFGSAPDAVGRGIKMNGDEYTVVGVLPENFHLESTNFNEKKDVYIPVAQDKDPLFYHRDAHEGMRAVARLKPGVPLAAAQADMDQVARNLEAAYPDADKGAGILVAPLKEDIVGDVRPFLWILLGAVGLVLLIACVNVSNLQLARAASRSREFAIRSALGASSARVVRQLFIESFLLALAGGAIGLGVAAIGTRAALKVLPETLPRAQDVGVDGGVLVFTLVASILASLVFGLAPAVKAMQPKPQDTLRESGRGLSGVRHRALGFFVVAEMAMALVLLIGAGLMIRSLLDLWNIKPGFNPHGVLTFGVTLSPSLGVNPATNRSALRETAIKLKEIPGIQAVSITGGSLPMTGDNELPFWVEGRPKPANESELPPTLVYFSSPGYLEAMQISLHRGRFFTEADDEHSAPVVVIDESFARQYFPNEDPIGKHIHFSIFDVETEIVGVVGHVKHWGLDTDATNSIQAQAYMPYMQIPDKFFTGPPQAEVVVRTAGAPAAMTATIREALGKMNSENVIFGTETMDAIIGDSLAARRFSMILLTVFAALALLLASIGIYGVISYVAGQRTHEIGIRMALGAQRGDVLRLMLGQGMSMALVGVTIGVGLALGLTRFLGKLLFGVSPADPLTFAAVAIILSAVALSACYIPSRRAMRVDPMVALRYE
jgi:predicted permease